MKGSDWAKVSNYIAFGIIGLGFLALFLGWNGAANQACVDCQIPYLISGGMLGLALVFTGIGVLFVQNTRRNTADLEQRLIQVTESLERSGTVTSVAAPAIQTAIADREGLVVAGASSYHRPDCHLAEGRDDAEFLSAEEAEERGLRACRICKP